MTHILTIETSNATHFEQFKELTRKLGVTTIEKHKEEKSMNLAAQTFL